MTDVIRTPDERFADLPEFPFVPHYTEHDGLRMAHVDEGEGSPVVLLHGEPTWSFLWRKVIGPLVEAGHRCLAPDLPGFGRSDKPTVVSWYSYDRHTAAVAAWLQALDVRDATLVVHDWGGPIGLRIAVEQPERVTRLVILDTGLFTGAQRMSDAWLAFRDFVARTEDVPVGLLVRRACYRDPGDVLPLPTGRRFAAALGGELSHVIGEAGHFLQEDAGAEDRRADRGLARLALALPGCHGGAQIDLP